MSSKKCPICNSDSSVDHFCDPNNIFKYSIDCRRCGKYIISDDAKGYIEAALGMNEAQINEHTKEEASSGFIDAKALCIEAAKKAIKGKGIDESRSVISYILRKRTDIRSTVTTEVLVNVLKNNSLPTPAELANNLVVFLGETLSSPGTLFDVPGQSTSEATISAYKSLGGLLGLKIGKEAPDLYFIITSLDEQKIISVNYQKDVTSGGRKIPVQISLTLSGWQKFEEIKHSVTNSRRAFVAMEFASANKPANDYFFQNELLDKHLVPAVAQTGYKLSNPLGSDPKAGNIHARLEVEIRLSRFVIAELSHHNNGAYWEAGFARGLGKPVIYMYNKEIGKSPLPHFDVGSDHIIFWEKDKPEEAAKKLKGVIRATLYGEALMTDD